jgi:hypothetical protein
LGALGGFPPLSEKHTSLLSSIDESLIERLAAQEVFGHTRCVIAVEHVPRELRMGYGAVPSDLPELGVEGDVCRVLDRFLAWGLGRSLGGEAVDGDSLLGILEGVLSCPAGEHMPSGLGRISLPDRGDDGGLRHPIAAATTDPATPVCWATRRWQATGMKNHNMQPLLYLGWISALIGHPS